MATPGRVLAVDVGGTEIEAALIRAAVLGAGPLAMDPIEGEA